ncbi:hypothetical protein GCM10011344_34130 [Dokdonia pacifica]|uniref:Tetratricopeptide repeat-containing protein n=1 Tax=Dokdonia pacifica TaxID=1627892 RepID=A0A239BAF7_9FLAO|nr:tetratricopeptide repeat protein [Dokdonia pacifica]GGG30363.1 hypothetical protein GCM10011344_34130 [Dokdonia pacifica]SNS05005.1 hypothetical protein SAMN06265376_10642 [Dokdonia pacifica]
MNDDELKNEAIERYLLTKMTVNEREEFEEEMIQNPELKEQVALYKALYNIDQDNDDWITIEDNPQLLKKEIALFRSQETKEFSKSLKQYRQANTKEKESMFKMQRWSAIAAIVIIGVFILYPRSSDLPDLYEQYHNWEELPSYVSKGENTDQILEEIEATFRSKKYQNIITLSQTLDPTIYETNPQVLLFIGVSYLETNQYKNALTTFDRLTKSDGLDFHKGYWYKVLTFLKQEDKENAVKTLKTIMENPTYYKYSSAKELLKELE